MASCKTCIYASYDGRYEKDLAKCLRQSYQGAGPVMVRLNDVCPLFRERPKNFEEAIKRWRALSL